LRDLLVVGHLCIDYVSFRGVSPRRALGGPPAYTSLAALAVGATVSIVSTVGADFPGEYVELLSSAGVDTSGLKFVDAASTSYELVYERGGRRLKLRSLAPPITSGDIPRERFRAAHASPIAGELSVEVLDELRSRADVLSLDPQGFVRGFDEDGYVHGVEWMDRHALSLVDVVKASSDELRLVSGFSSLRRGVDALHGAGVDVVVVTLGERGSIVSSEGVVYHIPTCKPRVVVDPTGAGDAYIGAFLAEYVRGREAVWCGCVGSAAASLMVESAGPTPIRDTDEIMKRASEAWDATRKLDIGDALIF